MKKFIPVIAVALGLAPVLFLTQNFGYPPSEATSTSDANADKSKIVEKKQSISISFETIRDSLYSRLQDSLDRKFRTEKCDEVGTKKDIRPKESQYRCNEIPYGDILNDKEKLLLDVKFEKQSGKQGGGHYSFDQGHFPLYVSRHQNYGKAKVALLDSKSAEMVDVQKKLSDNVYIEQDPKGGALDTRLCMLLPGLKVYSEKQTLHGDIKKKLWFFSLHANVKLQVDLGMMSFESAKICGVMKTKIVEGKKIVVAVDEDSVDADFSGVKREGLKVDSEVHGGWFVSLLMKIANFFGSDIEKQIENAIDKQAAKMINKKIPKLNSADFKSGKWLEHYVKFRYAANLLTSHVDKNVDEGYIGLREQVAAACMQAIGGANMSDNDKRDALAMCASVVQLEAQLFVPNTESVKKGCYRYSVGLNAKAQTNSWWGQQCSIDAVVKVSYREKFDPFYTCLIGKMRDGTLQDDSCLAELRTALDTFRASGLNRRLTGLANNARIFDNWDEAFRFANLLWGFKDDGLPGFMKDYKAPAPFSQNIKPTPITEHGEKRLTVLTYNIQGLPAPVVEKPEWTFEEIGKELNARLLRGNAPDVVMFQEMVSRESENVVKFAGYPYVYFGAPRRVENTLRVGLLGGDVIISRYPIMEAQYVEFGPKLCLGTDCVANKAWILVRVKVPGVPHLVEFVNVHMQSVPGLVDQYSTADLVTVQKKQSDLLANFYKGNGGYGRLPVIMAADFNFKPNIDSYAYFMNLFKVKDAGYYCTVTPACSIKTGTDPESLWKKNVDHHFYRSSNAIAIEPLTAEKNFDQLVKGIPLSDHLGFEMDYRLSW